MKKIIFLIIALIFVFSGCGNNKTISVQESENYVPGIIETKKDSELVHKLFSMRNTELSDSLKVENIIKIMPYISEEKFEIKTSDGVLDIFYTTDLRSKYRDPYELEKKARQTSVNLFPFVNSLDGINISVSDVYGEFASYSYLKDTVSTLPGGKYFTVRNMENAVKSKKELETYLIKVIDMKGEETGYEPLYEKIFKKISDNEIVNYEKSVFTEIVYKGESIINGFNIKNCANKNKINLEKYIDTKLTLAECDIVDFTNGKTTRHYYVFKSENILMSE